MIVENIIEQKLLELETLRIQSIQKGQIFLEKKIEHQVEILDEVLIEIRNGESMMDKAL